LGSGHQIALVSVVLRRRWNSNMMGMIPSCVTKKRTRYRIAMCILVAIKSYQ
jgi:hypothetical protein